MTALEEYRLWEQKIGLSTLQKFEALVLAQQPASDPWQPVTDYSYEARKEAEGIHPQLIKDVFQPTSVLDAGCGPNGTLVKLLSEIGVQAVGFDPQVRNSPFNKILFHGSLTDPHYRDGFDPPWADLVICREVLEHLTIREIAVAVRNICSTANHFVYVTTRFAQAPTHLLDVDTSDDLDPTHISMLNQDLLRLLFVLEGFKRRGDLEEQMDWQKKGRVLVYERAA